MLSTGLFINRTAKLVLLLVCVCQAQLASCMYEGVKMSSVDAFLLDATFNNNFSDVETALLLGGNIEVKNRCGETPLFIASKKGFFDIAKLLIERGANMRAKNRCGVTPGFIAQKNGHKTIPGLLIRMEKKYLLSHGVELPKMLASVDGFAFKSVLDDQELVLRYERLFSSRKIEKPKKTLDSRLFEKNAQNVVLYLQRLHINQK